MRTIKDILVLVALTVLVVSCKDATPQKQDQQLKQKSVTAKDILGNSEYLAISYGGYRMKSRDSQPTIKELKEDLRILHAMDIKVLRTYNVQLPHASNVLKAIRFANEHKGITIGLTGFGGGELAELASLSVVVSSRDYGVVEDTHLILNHMITRVLRSTWQDDNR